MRYLLQCLLLFIATLSISVALPVNINQATPEEMSEKLPGIGQVKAEAIVEYREKEGKIEAKDELLNISGIGEKTFEEIKDKIILSPEK